MIVLNVILNQMPSLTNFFLIIISALGSIIGNSLFRLGLKKTGIESLEPSYLIKNFFSVVFQPLTFAGFVVFGISAVIWLRVLTVEPLSKTYPVLVGFVIVFIIVSSILFLREPLSLTRIAGMALIIAGTALVFLKG